jgi:hypothetical protein
MSGTVCVQAGICVRTAAAGTALLRLLRRDGGSGSVLVVTEVQGGAVACAY